MAVLVANGLWYAAVALVLFWLGVFSADVVLPLQMALMLPSMILALLYRVDEYARDAHTPAIARPVP